MVNKLNRPVLTTLKNFLEKAVGIAPRYRETWDVGDVFAPSTGAILIRWVTGRRRVTRIG